MANSVRKYIIFVVVILMSFGCARKPITLIEYRDKIIERNDTINTTDSIFVYRYEKQRNDTIFIIDSVKVIKLSDRVKTEYINVTDSIPYEVQVIKEVRKRNGYDKFTSAFFWIELITMILYIIYKIWKRKIF